MFSSMISDKRARCPHCRSRGSVQSTVELRPCVQYVIMRCISCSSVYDAEVMSNPATASAAIPQRPVWAQERRSI